MRSATILVLERNAAVQERFEQVLRDAARGLEAVNVPAYVVGSDRRVRWQNAASRELVGDLRGRLDASVLAPSDLPRAREAYARKQDGAPSTELEVSVSRPDGSRVRV